MITSAKIIGKNGLLISFSIVLYFFLLRGFHLEKMPILRLVNLLIIFLGVYNAIKENRFANKYSYYWNNVAIGVYAAILGLIISVLSLIIYVTYLHPSFINILQNHFFFWKTNLSLFYIASVIFLQGLTIALISAFIVAQIWKKESTN